MSMRTDRAMAHNKVRGTPAMDDLIAAGIFFLLSLAFVAAAFKKRQLRKEIMERYRNG